MAIHLPSSSILTLPNSIIHEPKPIPPNITQQLNNIAQQQREISNINPQRASITPQHEISSQNENSPDKKTRKRGRNWTVLEREAFVLILADENNNFALRLEQMCTKRQPNTSLLQEIQKKMLERFEEEDFIQANGAYFRDAGDYTPLDTSVNSLRNQYNTMKKDWKRPKGKIPNEDKKWVSIMEPIWKNTVSFDSSGGMSSGDSQFSYVFADIDGCNADSAPPRKKVKRPPQKTKTLGSMIQTLDRISNTLEKMSSSQSTRHEARMEAEERRFERLLLFKREEAEAQRRHEINLANIIAGAMSVSMSAAYNSQYSQSASNNSQSSSSATDNLENPSSPPNIKQCL